MLIFNILLTTLIFIFTPLACIGFYKRDRQYRAGIEEKKAQAQASCEKLQRERSLIRQADSRLDAETAKIAELYRITRDMSAVLTTKEIFDILGNQLNKNFDFKKCRLILINQQKSPFEIEKVFELKYQQTHSQPIAIETQDSELLKYSLESEKIGYIEQGSFALLPLFFETKFTGVLTVEGLSANLLEGFSILANQFLLEFKRIKLYQKIQLMAITDGLTKLAARRYFLERLQEEIERSRRHNLKTALLMLDIDHFKQCNDHFGHLTGDVVLKEVAKRAKDCVREIDLVGRYGGRGVCPAFAGHR